MSAPFCINNRDFRPPGNITVLVIYSKPGRSASLPEGKRIENHLGELLVRPEVSLTDFHPVRKAWAMEGGNDFVVPQLSFH